MILGLMPVADDYRLTTACAIHFSKYVDKLIFRYDIIGGYDFDNPGVGGRFHRGFFKENEHMFHCEVEHFDAEKCKRRGFQFLGDFDKRVNEIKPDLVFTCDSDEMYPSHEEFWPEVLKFWESKSLTMWFRGEWVLCDKEPPYGVYSPHCKVAKYREGMSFCKTPSNAPNYPNVPKSRAFRAKCHLKHWNYFTLEMREERKTYLMNRSKKEGRRMINKMNITFRNAGLSAEL